MEQEQISLLITLLSSVTSGAHGDVFYLVPRAFSLEQEADEGWLLVSVSSMAVIRAGIFGR